MVNISSLLSACLQLLTAAGPHSSVSSCTSITHSHCHSPVRSATDPRPRAHDSRFVGGNGAGKNAPSTLRSGLFRRHASFQALEEQIRRRENNGACLDPLCCCHAVMEWPRNAEQIGVSAGRQNISAWEEKVGESTAALIELLGVYAEEGPERRSAH